MHHFSSEVSIRTASYWFSAVMLSTLGWIEVFGVFFCVCVCVFFILFSFIGFKTEQEIEVLKMKRNFHSSLIQINKVACTEQDFNQLWKSVHPINYSSDILPFSFCVYVTECICFSCLLHFSLLPAVLMSMSFSLYWFSFFLAW